MTGQTLGLCWGSMPGSTLLELAEAASAAGLSPLAAMPGQVTDILAGGMTAAELRRRLRDLGVRVAVIDPLISAVPGTPAPGEVEPRLRHLFGFSQDDCWRAAEAVEAPAINFTHFLGTPQPLAAMRDALARLAGENRAHGVASTFEFIPGTGVPDLAGAARLTEGIADLRIMFDMWHFARSHGRIEDIDALPPHAIGGVQINDWSPPSPGQPYVPMAGRLMPGEGHLPLAEILRRIEANSPGQDVCIEVFNARLETSERHALARELACRSKPFLC